MKKPIIALVFLLLLTALPISSSVCCAYNFSSGADKDASGLQRASSDGSVGTDIAAHVGATQTQINASDGMTAARNVGHDEIRGGSVRLPVVMYHNILNSRKGRYIVSEKQLDDDLQAITDAGYVFVSAQEVIDFANGLGTLPKKPLLLTFDDGRYNNMYYGLPLFKKHNAKVLFNIVGAFSEFNSVNATTATPITRISLGSR